MREKSGLILVWKFLSVVTVVLLMFSIGYAANTFEESKGRFSIDLPKGWKLEPQTDQTTYVFKGDGNSIIIQYFTEAKNREQLFQEGLNTLRSAGLPNAKPTKAVRNLNVSNNPAKWGIYNDTMLYGSVKVLLYGLLGSVSLKKGGLYYLVIVNEKTLKRKQKIFEKAFQSIRSAGGSVTKTVDEGAAAPEPAKTITGGPAEFKHKYLSLSLPAGWSVKEDAATGNELIGWLESKSIPGASIIVYSFRGAFINYSNVRIRGLKRLAADYPKGQKQLKKAKKIRTEKGYKPKVELWQGFLGSGGKTVALQSPMAVMKTKKSWILMIGYVPDASGVKMEEDFLKILKSAK
jgi:hypothetical protein